MVTKKCVGSGNLSKHSKWMVDSACTRHICNNRHNFSHVSETNDTVQVGNSEEIRAEGVGTVPVSCTVDGEAVDLKLTDVLYCPNIIYNLISSSQTRKNGLRTEIDDDDRNSLHEKLQLIHKKSGKVFLLAKETPEGLYEAKLTVRKSITALVSNKNTQDQ